MVSRIVLGPIVGAVGTFALDVITYGDIVLRGRGSSDTPARLAGVLLEKLNIHLPTDGGRGNDMNQNRLSGVGALMGYETGVMMGTVYGLVRPHLADMPWPVAGALLGLAAMAASDLPLAASGVSNPREWSGADWLADLVPHLGYGLVAAGVYELLADGSAGDTA